MIETLREHGRFAPTTSGPAHPGTLLAGLLAWLDARSLRQDCDPVTPRELLAGFAWDRVPRQDAVVRWSGQALEPLA